VVSVKPIVAVALLLVLSAPFSASPTQDTDHPVQVANTTAFPLHRAGISVHTTLSRPVAHAGDAEVQTAVVSNTGVVPLAAVRLRMDLESGCVRNIPWLLPRSSVTVTCAGTAGNESRTITAAVRGKFVFGRVVSAESTATLRIIAPAIAVHASVTPTTTVPGQHVNYAVTVTNDGDTAISGLALTADGAAGCTGPLAALGPGASTTARCTVTSAQQDGTATFTASGKDELGGGVHASDSARYDVVHPTLVLTVTGPDRPVAPGATATVTVRLRNTSQVTIADIRVTGVPAACEHTVGQLVPGADAVYTCLVHVEGPTTVHLTVFGLPVIGGTVVTTTGYEVSQTVTLRLVAVAPQATPLPPPPAPTTTVVTPAAPVRSAPAVPPPPVPTTTPPPPAPRPRKVVLDSTTGPLKSPGRTAAIIAVLGVLVMTVSVGAIGAATRPGK
jgi:hypothetical protein